ncbi:response regulator [Lusitaniella coriacea LEGE 07157]|uniref:Circadian input-output histidine kinase CikA n=1 Tax=Lusitaniella coriacea LEGE 07157 TaxID=945747 RepID=A0A8J7JFM0_9CYAN|nr:response regulator [Lusitaniella coriacea]MBE9118860.1 response regulator [Lusitaniella coriacea LEGE 07157]
MLHNLKGIKTIKKILRFESWKGNPQDKTHHQERSVLSVLSGTLQIDREDANQHWPLWLQTGVTLGVAILAVGFGAGELVRYLETDFLFRNLDEQTDRTVSLISAISVDSVIAQDRPILETIINQAVSKDPTIIALEIDNDEGQRLAAWNSDDLPQSVLPIAFTRNIVYEGEVFGRMRIELNIAEADRAINAHVNKMRVVSIGGLLLLTTIVIILLNLFVIRPVDRINRRLLGLAAGDWSQKMTLPGRSSQEFVRLGNSVNLLGDVLDSQKQREAELERAQKELDTSHRLLADYNQTLEQKVEQRTTELAESIEEAREARAIAEEASKAKSAFLANMSHELRTPMNAIIGYSEMLQEEAEDLGQDDFVPDLKKIHHAGKHLLSLINDILDLSKIEAGRMELYLETFAIAPLIEEVVATVHPLIEKNSNRLSVNCPENIGAMRADLTKVRQSLLNLLSNASKFTDNGTIVLSVSRTMRNGSGWIKFKVSDTGIGLSPEHIDNLFQAFTQADISTTRKYGGTGLGLSITQRFCQMMGGNIRVESELGTGSTFTVVLPTQPQESPADGDEGAIAEEPEPETKTTILVIDDDPTIHDLLKRSLGKQGFQVKTAIDGIEGLRLAKTLKPDAITLDVMMPGIDGWGILSKLKADPELAHIPVIMMSIVDNKNLGYALGASDYLLKPIDLNQLNAVLQKYQADSLSDAVMVVDDDPMTREMIRRQVEKGDWQVVEAGNGREALEIVVTNPLGLIVLDLMMPEIDGFEFVRELRRQPQWRSIPIIVLTAKELSATERQKLNGAVEKIMQKGSYDRQTLLEEINSLLSSAIARQNNGCSNRQLPDTVAVT